MCSRLLHFDIVHFPHTVSRLGNHYRMGTKSHRQGLVLPSRLCHGAQGGRIGTVALIKQGDLQQARGYC